MTKPSKYSAPSISIPIREKLVSGNRLRKSRLHDEKGHFIGWKRLVLNAPPAILSGVLRIFLGIRPKLPWISYDAIRTLRIFLNKESRVLEFGSGMSTLWYAKHSKEVCSVEHNEQRHKIISGFIRKEGLSNIDYQLLKSDENYINFKAKDKKGFDLIMIDGEHRNQCAIHSINLIKPGGIIYLDNSDKHSSPKGGDTRLAENTLLRFAKKSQAKIFYFTDLAPTQFFAQEGMMIELPKKKNRS